MTSSIRNRIAALNIRFLLWSIENRDANVLYVKEVLLASHVLILTLEKKVWEQMKIKSILLWPVVNPPSLHHRPCETLQGEVLGNL